MTAGDSPGYRHAKFSTTAHVHSSFARTSPFGLLCCGAAFPWMASSRPCWEDTDDIDMGNRSEGTAAPAFLTDYRGRRTHW